MRVRKAIFCLLSLTIGLIHPTIVFSAPLNPADLAEGCDPSPYLIEEGQIQDLGSSNSDQKRDIRLQNKPSGNQVRGPTRTPKAYGCKRAFLYRGRLKPVDSYNRQDGEKLRPVLNEVPEAVNELETYQRNRRKVQAGAYLGTAGLLLALGGWLLATQYGGSTQARVRTVGLLGGLTIAVGSGIYSLTILRTNESYLQRAVDKYNRTKPDDPIVLQFSTGILF